MDCIVCGSYTTMSIFKPEPQPLVALNLPTSYLDAVSAPRFEMDWVLCQSCGHVFNAKFNYANIPYINEPNLMFNGGVAWNRVIDNEIDKHFSILANGVVVDIGCGAGEFLEAVYAKTGNNYLYGFEPGPDAQIKHPFKVIQALFTARHGEQLKPSTITCRNVLEHVPNPRQFLDEIIASCSNLLVEVPCFDNALREGRITDFLYEHNSNFSSKSLYELLSRVGIWWPYVYSTYNKEVLVGHGTVNNSSKITSHFNHHCLTNVGIGFSIKAAKSLERIPEQINDLRMPVIWGGTGKGAAFINYYKPKIMAVVDSDTRKQGKFVPGTGNYIQAPSFLNKSNSWDIIIPSYWRVSDILAEIKQLGIEHNKILATRNAADFEWVENLRVINPLL